jgi:hypothetical protein
MGQPAPRITPQAVPASSCAGDWPEGDFSALISSNVGRASNEAMTDARQPLALGVADRPLLRDHELGADDLRFGFGRQVVSDKTAFVVGVLRHGGERKRLLGEGPRAGASRRAAPAPGDRRGPGGENRTAPFTEKRRRPQKQGE